MAIGASDAELRFKAELEDDVSPKIDRLEKKLREAGASPAEIKMMLKAYDEISPKLDEVQKQMDKMPKEQVVAIKAQTQGVSDQIGAVRKAAEEPIQLSFVDNLKETMDKLFNLRTRMTLPGGMPGMGGVTPMLYGLGAGGIGAGVGAAAFGAVQQGIQVNQEMEQSMVTLTQTLRDSAQAKSEMQELIGFAQKTPFAYQDVLQGDVRLRSYQIPTMPGEGGPNNQGWLGQAGDMAAAMGTPLTQAVEAIADARQGYFVRMMSYGIRMMREDFQKGGKYAGLSYEQGLERALKRFDGSMEMQSKTFTGVISNIQDIIQQQFYQPIGQEPFGIVSSIASSAYEKLNDPETLKQIGKLMDEIQRKQEDLWTQVQRGADIFRAHMQEPLQEILKNIIEIGKNFTGAFGGTTLEVIKTVATALGAISKVVTSIISNVPGLVQLYGTMKALSMLGFHGMSDPFFNLLRAVNPLTFSFTALGRSLISLPGMFTKLGIALLVKSFIDAKEAAAAFNREFENTSEMGLEKLNSQVEILALRLGTSATEMRNLATYAGQAMEGTGKPGVVARGALYATEQAQYMKERFGTDPMDTLQMVTDEIKQRGVSPTQGNLEKLYTTASRSASALEKLGLSAEDASTYLSTFGKQAGQAGFNRFGSADELAAMQLGIGNLTDKQAELYKNPTNMIRTILGIQGTPAVTDVQTLRQRGGSIWDYFGMDPSAIFSGRGETGRSSAEKAFRNLQLIPGARTSIDEVYQANEAAKGDAQAMVSRIAPSVTLPRIINPWLDEGIGGGLGSLSPGSGASAKDQMNAITREWLQADQVLQDLNTHVEEQQEKITKLTNEQVVYQQAQDLVNRDLQVYQHRIAVANRAVEDLSLAMQQWQLDNIRPLERQMQELSNESAILSNSMTVAQREMQKYSQGLLEGEQAALNQTHALELYNKQLQLLKLSYTSIGAELGRTTYEQGYSSRVEPMAGISLNMQMERLQREQERKQLEYDLTYGEQHYQMQQAARTRNERTERPFEERMQHIRESRKEIDRLTTSQFHLGQEQFELGQKMFKANQQLQDQQDHLTQLQINMQAMQQSDSFRALQDEQYELQMKLGDVNRELELQNMNLTQWQNIMDDLKSRKETLGELFADAMGAKGDSNFERMQNMLKMARDLGTITKEQYRRSMDELRKTRGEGVEALLGDPRSDVEKWFDTFRQTLIGLFSGQTWSALGQIIKTGLMEVLGKELGGAIGGPLSTAVTAGGTGYSILTGLRFAQSMGRYTAFSGAGMMADRLTSRVPQISPVIGRGFQALSGTLEGRAPGAAAWFGRHADDLLNSRSDLGGLIRGWRGSFGQAVTDPFRLFRSLRRIASQGPLAGAARFLGVPEPAAGMVGAIGADHIAQNTTFRQWGRGAASAFRTARGVPDAARDAVEGARRFVVGPSGEAVEQATRTLGPVGRFFSKVGEVFEVIVKSPVARFASKALGAVGVMITAIQGISDVFDIFQGKADKGDWFRTGGMAAGAIAGGFIGGPLGAVAGAGIGQIGGDLLSKVDWGEVKDFIAKHLVDVIVSPWSVVFEGLAKLTEDVPVLGDVIGAISDALTFIREGIEFLGGGALKGLWEGAKWSGEALWKAGKWIFEAGKKIFNVWWDLITPLRRVAEFFWKIGKFLAEKAWDGVKRVGNFIADRVHDLWEGAKSAAKGIAWAANKLADAASWVWDKIKDIGDWIADRAHDLWQGVKDAANGFADIVSDVADTIAYTWGDLIDAIVDTVNKILPGNPAGDYVSPREKEEQLQAAIASDASDPSVGTKGGYTASERGGQRTPLSSEQEEDDQKTHNKRLEDENDRHRRHERDADERDKNDSKVRQKLFDDIIEKGQKATQRVRELLQQDHNKKTEQNVRDGMRDSRDQYNKGWSNINHTTNKWIGQIQRSIKDIDEDIGLTKSHKDDSKDNTGPHRPVGAPHAHGGFIEGDKYAKRGTLIRVGEEGFDEMVIPLAPHRRDRAVNLMRQARSRIGEYANGGVIHEGIPGQDMAYKTAKGAYDVAAKAEHFAKGGTKNFGSGDMGDFSGPHGSLAGMTPVANLAASKFGLQVTAGKDDHSVNTSSGSISDHSWGGALDLSNGTSPTPQMDAWWNFLHSKLGKVIKQIIYKHMGANTGPSDWYYSGTDHFNHVHTAMLEQYASNAPLMASILASAMKGQSIKSLMKGTVGGGMASISIPDPPEDLKKMGPLGKRMYQAYKRKQDQWQKHVGTMGGGSSDFSGIPVSGNLQKMAHKMVVQAWGEAQWSYFNDLVNRESGWDPQAVNSSSGAAGLAQALPPSKYPPGAWPYTGVKSARLQLEWMIDYIKGRYGTPAEAIAWHDANNWYANGGIISDRRLIGVGEEGDEVVVPLAPHRRDRAKSLINQAQKRIDEDDPREKLKRNAATYKHAQIDRTDILPDSDFKLFAIGGTVAGFQKYFPEWSFGEEKQPRDKGEKKSTGPSILDKIIREANRIDALKSNYVYGGGHVDPAPSKPPWDCSSSVSRLVQAAGLDYPTSVSGSMMNWGKPGKGPFTIYANPGHVYAVIKGRAWGTSSENPGGGPGWIDSYVDRPGFAIRYLPEVTDTASRGKKKSKKGAFEINGYQVPAEFAKLNHKYKAHWAPDWSGETIPFDTIARLAEWAGNAVGTNVPGIAMAQVTKGESAGRPGAAGVDPGGTKGYGLWAITTGFNDANVKPYGGYEEMWNPVKNALVMAKIYGDMGISAWYGTRYLTDPGAHYTGRGYAAGIGRVPSTGPANLHEGEMVLPSNLADVFRSLSKRNKEPNFGNFEEQSRRFRKILEHLEDMRSKLKKAEKHLANAEDKDDKTKWKEKISKLQDRIGDVKEKREQVGQQIQKSTRKRIRLAGDESGGEETLAAVTSEKEKFRAKTKKAVEKARGSREFKKERHQARRARKRVGKLKKGGVTKKERGRIKKLRKQFDDPGKVVKRARGRARKEYTRGAARKGIAPDLVQQITHHKMSRKELKKYEDRLDDAGKKKKHDGRDHDGKRDGKDKDDKKRSNEYETKSLALLQQLVGKNTHVNLDVKAQGAKVKTVRKPAPRRRK